MFEILTGTPVELRGIEQFLILLSLILRNHYDISLPYCHQCHTLKADGFFFQSSEVIIRSFVKVRGS